MRRSVPVAVAAALAVLAVLAGCTAERPGPGAAPGPDASPLDSPLDDCAALSGPPRSPADGPDASAGASGDTGGPALPELALPCVTGGEPVALAGLRGPAVVNLWASWCPPCREELPVLQEYADRTAGSVHVVGVVTGDSPQAAAALATDSGVSFPGLLDRDMRVFESLPGLAELDLPAPPALGLPVTLFVDADGRIVHARAAPLTEGELARLSTEHLGVAG